VSVRAVRRDPTYARFYDLSTLAACPSHGIGDYSSACRYAVSLGLIIYYPYGPMGTSQFLPLPGELSFGDILTPTPGWLPPDDPTPDSPAQDAHTMARACTESLLTTDHLVAHASQWVLAFHDFFLNKSAAVSALMHTRPEALFLAHQTSTTHRPRFARRRPLHGAAFTSAACALRYAMGQADVQYIYMLPTTQCQIVDVSAPRIPVSAASTHALAMGAALVDVGSLPAEHAMSHIPPLHVSTMRPLSLNADDQMSVHLPVDGAQMPIKTVCDAAEWMGQAAQTHDEDIARPLQVVCEASLQKLIHPHLLRMYLDQAGLTAAPSPPRERWLRSQSRIRLAREACI
jgi:hypothetical protein